MREYVYVEYRHLENKGYGVGFFFHDRGYWRF